MMDRQKLPDSVVVHLIPSQQALAPPQAWPMPAHGGLQEQSPPWQSLPAASRQRLPSQQGATDEHFS
jgi:hypothetical protein